MKYFPLKEYNIFLKIASKWSSIYHVISANNPEDIDYTKYGIKNALVIDNTGAFRDKEALSRHLKAKGVNKVLLTAPGAGVPNIVYGVNQKELWVTFPNYGDIKQIANNP